MSVSTQTIQRTSTSVSVNASTNIKITNLSVPTAASEVSHALTDNLKQFIIRCRGNANLQIAFVSTESGTKYLTVPRYTNLSLSELSLTSKTLYVQADQNSQIVEIVEFY